MDFEMMLPEEQRVVSSVMDTMMLQGDEAAIRTLQELPQLLSPSQAGPLLCCALENGSPELFRVLLEHCERGECIACLGPFDEEKEREVWGSGSILMLAAMLDRPHHAEILLEYGYDCNGASLELANFPQNTWLSCDNDRAPHSRYSGVYRNQLSCRSRIFDIHSIHCATPLAAALLCGSLETARVLLDCPGIWTGESTALCRAAVLVLEGHSQQHLTPRQRQDQLEILRLSFCPEQPVFPPVCDFLRMVDLHPDSFVDLCSTRTLRCQLEAGRCSREEAVHILKILGEQQNGPNHNRCDRGGKLLLLKQYFPDLCRTSDICGVFLREAFRRCQQELPYRSILKGWKQLCGKERDLTWLGDVVWDMNFRQLRDFLKEAEDGGYLVMDADAIENTMRDLLYRTTLEILGHVRFRYRHTGGISGLTQLLLGSGDLRILRYAAEHGFFQQEKTKALMEYLIEFKSNRVQNVRAAVLAGRNENLPPAPTQQWQDPRRWCQWGCWRETRKETSPEQIKRLMQEVLPEQECLWMLFCLCSERNWNMNIWKFFWAVKEFGNRLDVQDPRYSSLNVCGLAAVSCCARHDQIMRMVMEYLPDEISKGNVRAFFGEQLVFRGTALALSAALGRTEQVKFLLDSGIDPDETGMGIRSGIWLHQTSDIFPENSCIPVTPLLAAILFGEEETARLLLERGAVCDFSRPVYRKILAMGSDKSFALAEKLPGVGFERIPKEELVRLRLLTDEQGAQSHYWRALRGSAAV